jgi:hypothetical protein
MLFTKISVTEKSLSLSVFHSFTGCDTTAAFFGRGKKSTWEPWKRFPDVTDVFALMTLHPYTEVEIGDAAPLFQLLECFTVIMIRPVIWNMCMKPGRTGLSFQRKKTMERLPPTPDALLQHTGRVAMISGWNKVRHYNMHLLPKVGVGVSMKTAMGSCLEHVTYI